MRWKIKSEVTISTLEWFCIAMVIIVVVLLVNGNVNEAMAFVKSCWQLMKK